MELRLAEGVTRSRIMGRNGLTEIIRLSLTPTAKRNSYRVAILVGRLPRVACFARNPGLGNRNSYRVAAAYVSFVMEGIMFVCMDVGVAAAYVGFAMERYNVRVHGCRRCRLGPSQYFPGGRSFIYTP